MTRVPSRFPRKRQVATFVRKKLLQLPRRKPRATERSENERVARERSAARASTSNALVHRNVRRAADVLEWGTLAPESRSPFANAFA